MTNLEFMKCDDCGDNEESCVRAFDCHCAMNHVVKVKMRGKKVPFMIVGCAKKDIYIMVPEDKYSTMNVEKFPEKY